uniref:response regulator n=1 Tax=Desulfosarcina cetonica TaxID=90730 RepID=UPI000A4A3047
MKRKIGRALVVGAGIGGIRVAMDLAQMGYGVTLIDRAAHMGGILSQLDRQFPSDGCGMCRMLPMVERDAAQQTCLRKGLFHERIDIRLGTQLLDVAGEPGKFQATLKTVPTPVDPQRCNGCGECAAVCPVEVPDAFNAGLTRRKAIYLPVPHMMPPTYAIDPDACTRCGACEPVCPMGAIHLADTGRKAFRILVVDDETIIRNSLDAWLGDEEGYHVTMAASGAEALERLAEAPFHLMLLDIKMPGMDGVEVLDKARVLQPALQVLMMTAYATVETAVEAMKIGAMDYLIKPFDPEALIPKVTTVFTAFEAQNNAQLAVGAIVLATGTTAFDPSTGKNPMGYGVVPNVVTGLELERMLSGSGPDGGRLLRPSDKQPVHRAAWIQCVGSRDLQTGADFCSTVCCMFALKEVSLARRAAAADFEATIIYMDLRTFGKSFERYAQTVGDNLRQVRGRVHSIAQAPENDRVALRWSDSTGAVHDETFDLVVLSTGQRPSPGSAALAEALAIDTDAFGFIRTLPFLRPHQPAG